MSETDDFTGFVVDDTVYETRLTRKFQRRRPYAQTDPKKLCSFIPGVIREIRVKPGQKVRKGDLLFILEAMKMQNHVASSVDGTVKTVHIELSQMVPKGQLLIEFE